MYFFLLCVNLINDLYLLFFYFKCKITPLHLSRICGFANKAHLITMTPTEFIICMLCTLWHYHVSNMCNYSVTFNWRRKKNLKTSPLNIHLTCNNIYLPFMKFFFFWFFLQNHRHLPTIV